MTKARDISSLIDASGQIDNTKITLDTNELPSVGVDKLSATGTKDATTFLRGDNSFAEVSVTPTAVSDQSNASTGIFDVPSGTTAERPASGLNSGNIRYNSSLGILEFYNGTDWQILDAYGATTYPITYTIVGGGGGGGYGYTDASAGGGGAGGVIQGTFFATVGTVFTCTVGAGGGGVTINNDYKAGNGGTSSISATGFTSLTAYGGNKGGNVVTGNVGPSFGDTSGGACGGGGGVPRSSGVNYFYASIGGKGTSQGSGGGDGGTYQGDSNFNGGGGGGGAGLAGRSFLTGGGPVGEPCQGGIGVRSIINTNYYGGGGAGGYGNFTNSGASGGTGGGGQGASKNNASVAGTANTGGGGGGGGITYKNGAAGGSGIVIISMPILRYSGTTTNSPTVTNSSNNQNKIITFNSTGTYTA
jgi:hypothetical protein